MQSMGKKLKLKLKLKQKLRSGDSSKQKKKWFLENGRIFLKELITDSNGKSIPIRSFSSDQILKATNNFDSSGFVTAEGDNNWYYDCYKVIMEDKFYLIKKFTEYSDRDREAYNDIVLSARMSNHMNFLKLYGCCLEFSFPVFVFEYAEHGVLNQRGGIMVDGEETILPWSVRLKIVKEIANAVTYLHMAFPKIIIHRDIKVTNIFLDKNWTAKLSDFSIAITLPVGKSRIQVERIVGTLGYIDPSYHMTEFVTEYTDVYSFGICLLVFLTGKSAAFSGSDGIFQNILSYVKGLYVNGKLDELIDPVMEKDITSGQRLQVEACVVLALRCCEVIEEDRPKIIQVAKELKRIETSLKDSS